VVNLVSELSNQYVFGISKRRNKEGRTMNQDNITKEQLVAYFKSKGVTFEESDIYYWQILNNGKLQVCIDGYTEIDPSSLADDLSSNSDKKQAQTKQ